ncbi:ABC transporter family substrate-binding protein [Oerskovia merdavium]|uniref:ABC transporter family substrate-binding protein n=1 Tax=Oerskovia merdavium TaxID=2762227 RepID=A0ABR8TZ47_9CELL|nr:ABC transporter family substrate-binding protein [Oerskovia merdavium]MBD7981056.1 ABC transporter family substrate-binding protein [Oerskovia merdavium]
MNIRRTSAVTAAVASVALVLTACGGTANEADTEDAGINQESAVTVAWEAPLNELNLSSSNGNATQNAVIGYMLNSGFNYYDENLDLVEDTSFGTYEKVSDDPLTVKYTVADDTKWSDGTAFDATDILLQWAGTSAKFNNVEPETDEEGNVTNQEALDAGVYFDGTTPGAALISATPEISEDGKSITFVYDKPFGDWALNFTNQFVPAHVVAQNTLDIEDAQEAKDALRDAILSGDAAKLSPVATFWNSGFEMTKMPEDKALVLSNGAYVLDAYEENQYLTLKANPDFKGKNKASVETITVRYIDDPMAQVQALQNGEVDLIGPQASADVRSALEALPGIETNNSVEGTFEHVDLVFANGGPFDPATYGGDAEKAKKVRQAFLTAIPRQTIVDNLIVPLNPDAEVRNSQILIPGSPNYDKMVAENGSDFYKPEADIEAAKALLAEAGVTTPVKVRFAYNNENARRVNELALITDTASQAGFEIVDTGRPAATWGTLLATGQQEYDASLFGWQSTSTAVTESDANYRFAPERGINNYGFYSNPAVDAALDQLQVATEPDEQFALQLEVEKNLWADAFGTTIFQFPAIQGWNENLKGVDAITISPTIFYGFWNWELGA